MSKTLTRRLQAENEELRRRIAELEGQLVLDIGSKDDTSRLIYQLANNLGIRQIVATDQMAPGRYMRIPDHVDPADYQLVSKQSQAEWAALESWYNSWGVGIAYIVGAVHGGGRGDILRRALTGYLSKVNGDYTTLIQYAAKYPDVYDFLRNRIENAHLTLVKAVKRAIDGQLDDLLEWVSHWNENAPDLVAARELLRTGRPPGLTPITQYILSETKRIRSLHQCKSRGAIFERFKEQLLVRPDVQAWRQIKPTDRPKLLSEQSVEVQAFHLLDGLDRETGAEKLREIERNAKRGKGG